MAEEKLNIDEIVDIPSFFGDLDINIRQIEKKYNINAFVRDDSMIISGEDESVKKAKKALLALMDMSNKGEKIDAQIIEYITQLIDKGKEDEIKKLSTEILCITAKGKPVKGKTLGQRKYINAIQKHTITVGIGPAGTGKTYLAVASAVKALKQKDVSRIVLTRPAVEAGEKLGFLPGDLQEKVDPYLRPIYDALFELLGNELVMRHIEKGIIEVAPLAYMRGRTLDDAFIILDEAQNTTPEQMKMFLTRFGMNSKMIVNGDITQIDIPDKARSGLVEASLVLRDIEDIAIIHLSNEDVVRHVLVRKIIESYDNYYSKGKKENEG